MPNNTVDLTTINARLTANETAIASLTTRVQAVETGVTAAKASITTLQDGLTAANAQIQQLKSSASPDAIIAALNGIRDAVEAIKINVTTGGTTGGTGGTTGGGTGTVDPRDPTYMTQAQRDALFFPSDYANAAFPSPERSHIIIDADGTHHGPEYIISAQGAVYRFDRDANGKYIPMSYEYGNGFQFSVNGEPVLGNPTLSLIVAQGQVYVTKAGGLTMIFTARDAPRSGATPTSVPEFFTDPYFLYKQGIGLTSGSTTGGGSTGGVPVPADPPAQSVAYGSTGKVITFGPAETFKKPSEAVATAVAGDKIKHAGPPGTVYEDTFKLPDAVQIDGGGRWPADMKPVRDAIAAKDYAKVASLYAVGAILDGSKFPNQPSTYAGEMGGIAYMGNGNVIGFEIRGYGKAEAEHGGTAGLRAYGSCVGQIQGSDNYIHDCQNGIGPGGSKLISGPWPRTVLHSCGLNDGAGGAHCVYDTGSVIRSIAGPDFYSDGGIIAGSAGHGYKSRARASVTIKAPFYIAGSDASALDIPDGTAAQCHLEAGEIEQYSPPGGDVGYTQHTLIGYGLESLNNGQAGIKADPGLRLHANVTGANLTCVGIGVLDVTGCVTDGGTIAANGKVVGL